MAAAAIGVADLQLLGLAGLAIPAVGSLERVIWTAAARTTTALRTE